MKRKSSRREKSVGMSGLREPRGKEATPHARGTVCKSYAQSVTRSLTVMHLCRLWMIGKCLIMFLVVDSYGYGSGDRVRHGQ